MPGSFARDTLIHELASLSRLIVRKAFEDARVCAAHRRCLEDGASGQVEGPGTALVAVGLERGTVQLLARPKQDEFFVECEHSDFAAVLVLGYRVDKQEFVGICVARFEGNAPVAIHYARRLSAFIGGISEETVPLLQAKRPSGWS